MTDEEKAEEYIINKYKLNKCYIVDTEETRVYMHNDVHSEYEEEYQIYLDGLAEGRKEGYEQGKNNERKLQCGKKNYKKDTARFEKENAELKEYAEKLSEQHADEWQKQQEVITELKAQIPQWHNLVENPNDLPKDSNKEFLVIYELDDNEEDPQIRYFISKFYPLSGIWSDVPCPNNKVIAWCEIPKFKE